MHKLKPYDMIKQTDKLEFDGEMDMRRKDREITEFKKIVDILNTCECCRLGFVDDGEAYIVPMNFGYELINDNIILYFHCAKEGRKIDLIPKQNAVSFEMDTKHSLLQGEKGCDYSFLYQCLMGKGNIAILDNESDKVYGLNKIMQHYTKTVSWQFDAKILDMLYILKLTVTEWSGKEH